MKPLATLVTSLVMALGAIGLAVAAPGGAGAELAGARVHAASGAAQIANSRAGQAVFDAHGMRPGDEVSGTVTIGNGGDVPGEFSVAGSNVQDVPGPDGGLLSSRIALVVLDVTDAQSPDPVYTGTPANFDQVALGRFAPGETRAYRFVATLPAAAGNAYQGSSLSLGFAWAAASAAPTATPDDPPIQPESKPPTVTPPVTTPPTTTPVEDVLGLPAATTCFKRGRLKLKLKAPKGTKIVSATVKVNNKVKKRVKGKATRKPVQLKGLGKKTAKITVSVKASNGRTYTAARTYRGCK